MLAIAPLFLHLLRLDDPVHVVVNRQVLQLRSVVPLVEHQLKLVVQRVRDLMLLADGHRRGRKYRVDCYFNCVLNHRRDQPSEVRRRQLQTRVRIYLDEPRLQLFVKHEVIAEDLKR